MNRTNVELKLFIDQVIKKYEGTDESDQRGIETRRFGRGEARSNTKDESDQRGIETLYNSYDTLDEFGDESDQRGIETSPELPCEPPLDIRMNRTNVELKLSSYASREQIRDADESDQRGIEKQAQTGLQRKKLARDESDQRGIETPRTPTLCKHCK